MATVLQHPFGTTAFGEFLRSARERRGLTVQQIANETKIPRRLLESLEHGDFAAIPAGMYQRAEIRAYAKAVGLDQAVALSELERALGARSADSSDRRPGTESETTRHHRRPFLVAGFAIAIAVIGIVTWYGPMTPTPAEEKAGSGIRAAEASPPQPIGAGATQTQPPQSTDTPFSQATAPTALGETKDSAAQPPPLGGLITELEVVTEPAGARVVVDGIGRGTTPLTIRYLTAGEKRVRVLKDGFSAEERTVRVAPARQATTLVIPLHGIQR